MSKHAAAEKKKNEEYIKYLELKTKTADDVADVRFLAMNQMYEMVTKIQNSGSSPEAQAFWAKKVETMNRMLDFINTLHSDFMDVSRYNEHNYDMVEKLKARLKETEEKLEKITRVAEEKFL